MSRHLTTYTVNHLHKGDCNSRCRHTTHHRAPTSIRWHHEVASLVQAISCDVAVKATMAVGRTPGVTLCNREDDSGANNRWID